ncbi:hypothetical protein QTP86_020238 [Hemibagrus guttatus]|nr:hypothetical protein QTP86_020238 [Hemibagrus guttatus]
MDSGVAVGAVAESHADSKSNYSSSRTYAFIFLEDFVAFVRGSKCERSHFLRDNEEVQEHSLQYEERIAELHSVIAELNERIGLLQCTTISIPLVTGCPHRSIHSISTHQSVFMDQAGLERKSGHTGNSEHWELETLRMDLAATASGGLPLQNTSPPTDPAELREIIVRQGALIRSYQDQVEALQSQLRSMSTAAPSRDPPAVCGLIDSGAAVNLIDWALVEELGIPTIPCIPSLRITAIDSQPIGGGYLTRQTELLEFQAVHGFFGGGFGLLGLRLHIYEDFREVFSEERAARLPSHQAWDCAIDLLPNASPPRGRVYPLSLPEAKAMEEYIVEALAVGHIQPSTSPAAAGFFFVGKKDGGLRPCIDYRGLNAITVRYPYPLPLVPAALEQLRGAEFFTKLDLRSAYNLVRICEGDEWKTAFHTTHGHYEYLVMPFGLTNAPAVFQSLINGVFQDILGKWVIAYIDDILVYSISLEEHQGVEMDVTKVQAVTEWPSPTTVKELQHFLGFANFYRRFIRNYSSMAGPLTKREDGEFSELHSELNHSQQEATEDVDQDHVSCVSLLENQSVLVTAEIDNCSDLNSELQRVLMGLESVVCGRKKSACSLSVAEVDRHIEQLTTASQHCDLAIKTVEEIEGALGKDFYPSLCEERVRWEKELAGLQEENERLTAMLSSKDEEHNHTKATMSAIREERDRLRCRVRELQTRLQSVQPGGGQFSPGRVIPAGRVNLSTGELSTSSSSNDIPVAKVAERVKLSKMLSESSSMERAKQDSEISSIGVSSNVEDHLAHSLQDCSNIQEIFQTLYSHGSAISDNKIREFEVETERLHSRIEHLKSQNDLLTITLEECKSNAERMSMLMGKYESNTTALRLALHYSEQCIEAYELLLALTDTEHGLVLGQYKVARVNIVGDQDSEESVFHLLKQAHDYRKTAETAAKDLLVRLDGSCGGIFTVTGCSVQPWESLSSNSHTRFREFGTISVRKGQGRKTMLDARDLRAFRRHCITYRNATVMEITTWAQEYFQKTLSVNTIYRAIRRCRLNLYKSKKKPYLNMIQKRRRFLWAKAHLKWTVAKWKTLLWSDESKFEVLFGKLGRHVIQTKEDKDNPSCYQRSVQKPASLMVWGCMSSCGMGSLHIWKGTINAESTTSSTASSCDTDFSKEDEQRLKDYIQQLKNDRAAVKLTMLELESVHIDPLSYDIKPRVDSHRLDLENAVLMQELMAMKEEIAEMKAQLYLLEKEKKALELKLSTQEAQEQAYLVQIEHLKSEVEEQQEQRRRSLSSTGSSTKDKSPKDSSVIVSELRSFSDSDPSAELNNALQKEMKLKVRVKDLVAALEKLTKCSEIRHQQSAEFVNDLKQANSNLVAAYEKAKKKHQNKLKKLESQMMAMVERHETQVRMLKQRITLLEEETSHQHTNETSL